MNHPSASKTSLLLRSGWLINPSGGLLKDGALRIVNGVIVETGIHSELYTRFPDIPRLELSDAMVTPGWTCGASRLDWSLYRGNFTAKAHPFDSKNLPSWAELATPHDLVLAARITALYLIAQGWVKLYDMSEHPEVIKDSTHWGIRVVPCPLLKDNDPNSLNEIPNLSLGNEPDDGWFKLKDPDLPPSLKTHPTPEHPSISKAAPWEERIPVMIDTPRNLSSSSLRQKLQRLMPMQEFRLMLGLSPGGNRMDALETLRWIRNMVDPDEKIKNILWVRVLWGPVKLPWPQSPADEPAPADLTAIVPDPYIYPFYKDPLKILLETCTAKHVYMTMVGGDILYLNGRYFGPALTLQKSVLYAEEEWSSKIRHHLFEYAP